MDRNKFFNLMPTDFNNVRFDSATQRLIIDVDQSILNHCQRYFHCDPREMLIVAYCSLVAFFSTTFVPFFSNTLYRLQLFDEFLEMNIFKWCFSHD